MAKERESSDYVMEKQGSGEVKIAADVVAVIAALAATEVEGVSSMAGNITNELISKFGMKNTSRGVKVTLTNELAGMLGKKKLTKGVKVQMELGVVHVDMMISVRYGYSIPKMAEQVQAKVVQQIETMTGLSVSGVNVRIAGVNLNYQ